VQVSAVELLVILGNVPSIAKFIDRVNQLEITTPSLALGSENHQKKKPYQQVLRSIPLVTSPVRIEPVVKKSVHFTNSMVRVICDVIMQVLYYYEVLHKQLCSYNALFLVAFLGDHDVSFLYFSSNYVNLVD